MQSSVFCAGQQIGATFLVRNDLNRTSFVQVVRLGQVSMRIHGLGTLDLGVGDPVLPKCRSGAEKRDKHEQERSFQMSHLFSF